MYDVDSDKDAFKQYFCMMLILIKMVSNNIVNEEEGLQLQIG